MGSYWWTGSDWITNQLFLRMCTNIQYRYHGDNSTDTMVTEFLELTSYLILILLGLCNFFCGDYFFALGWSSITAFSSRILE